MITLALDTATSRCTVAVTDGELTVHGHIDGARMHTREALGLVDDLVRKLGGGPEDIRLVLTGDGPGSFTGLRVATAIAKAITWGRPQVSWRVAPSLLIAGLPHLPHGGGRVLALSDALRGDLYAGCWDVTPQQIVSVACGAEAMPPDALTRFGAVTTLVATLPPAVLSRVESVTDRVAIVGEAALPDARNLIRLNVIAGGTRTIEDPDRWRPTYGRPVEAQVVWERKHGRDLPDQTYRAG